MGAGAEPVECGPRVTSRPAGGPSGIRRAVVLRAAGTIEGSWRATRRGAGHGDDLGGHGVG